MRAVLRLGWLIALLGIMGASSAAFAQDTDTERAAELFENGRQLYEEGDYDGAITAWEAARQLSEHPLMLLNLGNAYERAGDLPMAVDYFRQYRSFAEAEEREVLMRRVENLEARIAEQDDEPAPVERGGIKPIYWAVAGTAAVGFTLGAIFGLQALDDGSELETLCASDGACPTNAQEVLDSEKSNALIADIGFGIGIAATVGFVLGVILDPAEADGADDTDTAAGGWFDQNSFGFTLGGSF